MSEGRVDDFYRVCVKIYASEHAIEDDAALFVPIFHEWIRDRALDLVALDVADYAHAPESPGIMLVCHEVSFSLDRADGTFGLLAQRRTPIAGTAVDAIATTIRQALGIGARLEGDPRVAGKLKFDPSTLRIEANDRLLIPNSDAGYTRFGHLVREAVGSVLGGEDATVVRVANDPRDRLAVDVSVHGTSSDIRELSSALTLVGPVGSI